MTTPTEPQRNDTAGSIRSIVEKYAGTMTVRWVVVPALALIVGLIVGWSAHTSSSEGGALTAGEARSCRVAVRTARQVFDTVGQAFITTSEMIRAAGRRDASSLTSLTDAIDTRHSELTDTRTRFGNTAARCGA